MISLTDIQQKYFQISNDVFEGKIKQALDLLAQLIRFSSKADFFYQYRSISENYQNLLKYSFEGYKDPEKEKILKNICGSILILADDVKFEMAEKGFSRKLLERSFVNREFGEDVQTVTEHIDELMTDKAMFNMLRETGTTTKVVAPFDPLFRFLWLSGKLHDETVERLRVIAHSGNVAWHEKSLVVSGLTLSLLNYFDPQKIILLTEFIDDREHQVYQRALSGLLLVLIAYDKRITYFPDLVLKIDELSSDENIHHDTEALLLQLLMAKETEKITKAFETEVLPEMQKMMPRMEDKLQFGTEEEDAEGKNPGWKDMLDEVPGLFERIEKFTKMQMEGGDVFMSTFSMLKRFEFFNKMSNWFIPFYSDNPELARPGFEDDEFYPRLLEGLEKAFYLCNSDKYSFALNFHSVPPQQRSMLVSYFEAELEQMKELAQEEEILSPVAASNSVYIQYVQDLYRFFKLFPYRNEFDDVFNIPVHFNQLEFYRSFFERDQFTERLARFYFDKERYQDAIELFQYLSEKKVINGEFYEKIGYSYQKLGKYQQAIEFYKKADLFEGDHVWIMKKLAWCSMKIRNYGQALEYYNDVAVLKPDDLNIQLKIAQCHLHLRNYEEALEHYSRVYYYHQNDLKVLRPLAYLEFVQGRIEESLERYKGILESGQATGYDFINYAHVLLCSGKNEEAENYYIRAIRELKITNDTFRSAFEEDVPFLIKNGIPQEEIPLIIDHILFRVEEV